MENKVVKCINDECGLYFGHSEKNMKCPFCHTKYIEGKEKSNDKKESKKTQKKSFKVWKK